MHTKSPKRACKEVISFGSLLHIFFLKIKAYNFMLEVGSDFQLRVYVLNPINKLQEPRQY